MSISSVGGASGGLSQMLATMLSRLQQSQATQTTASASDGTTTTTSDASTTTTTSNALTGTDTSRLSDQIVGMLVMMQGGQPQSEPSSGATDTTDTADTTDPFQKAFSSMDANGDGTISQSELESVVTSAGGTAAQADTVYTALGSSSSTGISESQLASAAQAGGPPPGGPPPGGPGGAHRHHHGDSSSSSEADQASQIFSALDTNGDGTVSASELSASLGSTSDATSTTASKSGSIFSTMDSDGDGSVSKNELTSYVQSLQQQSQDAQKTLSTFSALVSQSYNSALGLMSSGTTSQATCA